MRIRRTAKAREEKKSKKKRDRDSLSLSGKQDTEQKEPFVVTNGTSTATGEQNFVPTTHVITSRLTNFPYKVTWHCFFLCQ
jgi:hypothetical protein